VVSIVLAAYALTLPSCPVGQRRQGKSLARAFGFNALILFKNKKMALFFIFSFLMGVSLQITNGYANPFIQSFGQIPDYEDLFFVRHSNLLVSFSQVSETFCILMIPFFLKRYGIKCVMLIAMLAWCVRFGFFAMGDPGSGVWLLILSCVVYGVAFDFFNISGSIFVDKEVDISMRSSAQGLFILMTSGLGSCVGSLGARRIVNHFVFSEGLSPLQQAAGWQASWTIFATYALIVAIAFAILFKNQRI
jgi:NHS family xanthosine MFS transporter